MTIGFDDQTTRIAIAVGIVVSMIWYERKNLSPGGVIVPGLLALFLVTRPLIIFYTLIVSVLTVFAVKKISDFVILFGRRRFSILMLVSFGIAWGLEMLTHSMRGLTVDFQVIGFIIPGLIANEMERQEIFNTISTLSTITLITLFVLLVLVGWSW